MSGNTPPRIRGICLLVPTNIAENITGRGARLLRKTLTRHTKIISVTYKLLKSRLDHDRLGVTTDAKLKMLRLPRI
ncbi:unnamed protein product [Pieris brassicae]|uniref:Uncharacterized protein n=1 Tax=Pieris brassicae TaxID=7116 RepID=A0A9P0XCD2_PIEBR|nr:unnamed protein product [Pieris brassicae]